MNDSENTLGATESEERVIGFRWLNPAFVTTLVTFVVATIVTSGLTVIAFLPITESQRIPIAIAYGDGTQMLAVPGIFLFLSWLISGFAGQRLWLQVVTLIAAFAATIAISGLLAVSVLGAGLAH